MPDPITTTDEVADAFTTAITILDAYRRHDHQLLRDTLTTAADPGLTVMTLAAITIDHMERAGIDPITLDQLPALRDHVRELAA